MERWNFQAWVKYFTENKDNLLPLALDAPYELTMSERVSITSSIQQFQIGESSEGKFLFRKAEERLSGIQDKSYLTAVTLFIKEEQRHARTLKEFMVQHDIPVIKQHWVDRVFRKLRRPFNLEMSVTVLITAEIIAAVYYEGLRAATKSPHLVGLCRQILSDEDKHIEFQSEALRVLLWNRWRPFYWAHRTGHRVLLEGTMCVVWFYHKSVLKAGGFTRQTFVDGCRKVYRRSAGIIEKRP